MCKITEELFRRFDNVEMILQKSLSESMIAKEGINTGKDLFYVTDIYTDEIVLINQAVEDEFGNIVGEKCYEALQGLHENCEFCTNDIISKQVGVPYEWEFYNKSTGKLYLITDEAKEVGGRLLRIERAKDITHRIRNIIELSHKYNLI
jgi:hypothetical protein